jgi:cell wall-associated NlpC family hydrolase
VHRQFVELARLKARAGERIGALKARQTELAEHKSAVQGKLAAAERLLARMTAAQRTVYNNDQDGTDPSAARADRSAVPRASLQAPNSRAAQAVAYAYGALGKPYVWGATGPSSFDCSGLIQAAWRSAGIALPRTTYTQINAGERVSRSQLAPGDLVFFYSGISHVGLYIGGGQMIHAPRPGAPVRVAPIDEMPFAGAARPA